MTISAMSSNAPMSLYNQSLKQLRDTRKNLFQRMHSGSKASAVVQQDEDEEPLEEMIHPIENWRRFQSCKTNFNILTSSDLHQAVSDAQESEQDGHHLVEKERDGVKADDEAYSDALQRLLIALDTLNSLATSPRQQHLAYSQSQGQTEENASNSNSSNSKGGGGLETLKELHVLRTAIDEVSSAYSSADPSQHRRRVKDDGIETKTCAQAYVPPQIRRKPAPRYRPESFDAMMQAEMARKSINPCASTSASTGKLNITTDGLSSVGSDLATARPLYQLEVDHFADRLTQERGGEDDLISQYFDSPSRQRGELLMAPQSYSNALPAGQRPSSRNRKTLMMPRTMSEEKVKSYLYVKSAAHKSKEKDVNKNRRATLAPALSSLFFSPRSYNSGDKGGDGDDDEEIDKESSKNSSNSSSDDHDSSSSTGEGEREDSITGDSSTSGGDDSTAPSSVMGSASPQSVKSDLSASPPRHTLSPQSRAGSDMVRSSADGDNHTTVLDSVRPPMRPRRHPDRSSVSLAESYYTSTSSSSYSFRSDSPPPCHGGDGKGGQEPDSYVIDYHQYLSSCDETPRPGALQFHSGESTTPHP